MTNWTREDIDILDKYVKGSLNAEELAAFQVRLRSDEEFSKEVDDYLLLLKTFKDHEEHQRLSDLLKEAHGEMESQPINVNPIKAIPRKSNRMFYGIAASVALVTVLGAYLMTQSVKNVQVQQYRELRRNVAQIQKSQNAIIKDMASEKKQKAQSKFAGTGFLISPDGYVTTSYHVVREQDSILIENEKFGILKTSIYYTDPTNDIAILKIESQKTIKIPMPYSISRKEIMLAEEVFTLGYPREDVVFGAGSVSAITGYNGNPNSYQVSVPANPGNSGGPLFSTSGELIGIISGKQNEISGAAFAIKSPVLMTLLTETMPDSLRLALPKQQVSLRSATRVDQVKRLRDYVFVVRVYKN
jgi:S1-C subfamily serine protease